MAGLPPGRAARAVLHVLALAACPAFAERIEPNSPAREVGFDQKLGDQFPLDLEFKDETGATVRLGQYFGKKAVLVQFVYFNCPMICSMALEGLAKTMKALALDPGRDFEIVTISFDPRDTPEVAAKRKEATIEAFGRADAAPAWHFLTGTQDAIRKVTSATGFRYTWDEEQQQFAHATGIVIVTPEGKIARYFFGVEYKPRDIRFGLVEGSGGKIGTLADQLLLLCYHYNPTTGKYGAIAMSSIRAGGLVTVLLLGVFIALMFRRERKRERAGAAPGRA